MAQSGRAGTALRESAFGGEADILWNPSESPLLTHCGHQSLGRGNKLSRASPVFSSYL